MFGTLHDLRRSLDHAGYYPELVADVLDVALAGEAPRAHLVHAETTFDSAEVRRHLTVLALTESRLVVAHVDDHPADSENPAPSAAATTEAVPLEKVHNVGLTHVLGAPERYRAGDLPTELTLAVGWGGIRRLDLEPAGCPDPACDADHGMTGTSTADDVVVRVSARAEGADAVRNALSFARALSTATSQARPRS